MLGARSMKLSIIICVYNTDKSFVDECLASLSVSTLADHEIVFVKDNIVSYEIGE